MHSLSRRLLLSVSAPLVLFFGVTIAVLDANFRDLAWRSVHDMLEGQLVALIGAAEQQPDGSFAPLPRALDSRLATAGSGLYGQIVVPGAAPWRSPSTVGTFIDFGTALKPGQHGFTQSALPDGTDIVIASRGISFEEAPAAAREVAITISVATPLTSYQQQLWSFRQRLFTWFIGLTLLLLATLGVMLRWVLAPLRRLEREITAVETGRSEALGDHYPRELAGVATNLNTLLMGERQRLSRYRNTLGNLAHSLKTPLAVMRTALTGEPATVTPVMQEQIDRMRTIIEHQLKRAASGGALLGQAPVPVAAVAAELRVALLKVYGRKDLSLELAIGSELSFVGDRSDLTELMGNLLDNACKWCRSRVRASASFASDSPAAERLILMIEDDGPGISAPDRDRVLERGVRGDENVPGHGLGLAMVQDTVALYGGRLQIDASQLGGARLSVYLPGQQSGAQAGARARA